jgi:hypothetical protein
VERYERRDVFVAKGRSIYKREAPGLGDAVCQQ